MLLSIVIPCYNEESVILETLKRLSEVSSKIKNEFQIDVELIFVNDGSKDKTLLYLQEQLRGGVNLKIVNFARNFGHQIAVTAGMDASRGDAVVLIDADLQDPPDLIIEMVKLWFFEKYDVIYATRVERAGETAFKKITANAFYKLLNKLSEISIPLDTGDFRLMSRRVVDTLNSMPENDRFIRGMVSWVGFKQISLPYKRNERFSGESKYPLSKMVSLALTGLMAFSTRPLKLASITGFISAFIAFVGLAYALILKIFTHNWITGWTSLILAILFLGGVQLICIGILGEYLGKMFASLKGRPLYVVEGYYGYKSDEPHFSRSPTKHVE